MKKRDLKIYTNVNKEIHYRSRKANESISSLSFTPLLQELPYLQNLPTISLNHPSKAAKKLKHLLPEDSRFNSINYLASKNFSSFLFMDETSNNKRSSIINDICESGTNGVKPKAISFFESDESSSKTSGLTSSHPKNKNGNPRHYLPQFSKGPEILITNNSLKLLNQNLTLKHNLRHETTSKILNKTEIQKRKLSDHSEICENKTPKIPKIKKSPSRNLEIIYQPVLEEPENLRKIENHPRIRKSTFSKADQLIKDWLDDNGKLTIDQTKILGNSERVQKKTIFYYINQMEEKRMPFQFFVDQKLLKRKKFLLASTIIVLATDNKPLQGSILLNVYDMFNDIKEFCSNPSDINETVKHMKFFIETAAKFPKHEVSVYLMKYFSKMLNLYNEYGNARNLNKTAFFMAKNNNLPQLMMTLHKRMGKFYRKLKITRLALKHFLRMLDMAWFLNNEQYEFLAYDEIGLCFYYLNEIDKANFYHLKMLEGDREPKESMARELGILKIKTMLANQARSSEDNLLNLSKESSEDEEELLFSEMKPRILDKKDKKCQLEMNIFMKKRFEKSNENLQNRPQIPRMNKRNSILRKFMVGNRELYLMDRTMVFEKKMHLISHLSRNRNLINFHEFHSKSEEENLDMHREIFKMSHNEIKQKVDAKNIEKLRSMVKKLKTNLEVCILYIETLKSRNGQDHRRTGMMLRPMK